VRFGYDGNANVRVENGSPYALAGDSSGNYYAWTPSAGSHSVTATPYAGANASGSAGASRTITFTVVDPGAAALAGASASSDPGTTGAEEGTAAIPDPPVEAAGGEEGGNCGALGVEVLLVLALLSLRRKR